MQGGFADATKPRELAGRLRGADVVLNCTQHDFNLQVMDATPFALCRDQKLPIRVFSIFKPGPLRRVVQGEDEGTLVHV